MLARRRFLRALQVPGVTINPGAERDDLSGPILSRERHVRRGFWKDQIRPRGLPVPHLSSTTDAARPT